MSVRILIGLQTHPRCCRLFIRYSASLFRSLVTFAAKILTSAIHEYRILHWLHLFGPRVFSSFHTKLNGQYKAHCKRTRASLGSLELYALLPIPLSPWSGFSQRSKTLHPYLPSPQSSVHSPVAHAQHSRLLFWLLSAGPPPFCPLWYYDVEVRWTVRATNPFYSLMLEESSMVTTPDSIAGSGPTGHQ